MRDPILLGPGVAPSVSWQPDGGWYVAIGGIGRVIIISISAEGINRGIVRSFPDGFGFPSLFGDWLAYKSNDATGSRARLWNLDDGREWTFGPAGGNFPLVLNDQYMAWQNVAPYPIERLLLSDPNLSVPVGNGAPDGLARIDPTGVVELIKDVRSSVPGMLNPQHAGALIVGEQPDIDPHRNNWPLGMAVGYAPLGPTWRGWMLGGQTCMTPHVACSPDGQHFAVVTWNGPGVRLQLFDSDEIHLLPPPPIAVAPTVPGPRSDPRPDDGVIYDLLPFILGESNLWPRTGSHPMHQHVAGPLWHFVKFGNPQAYETGGADANWIYHLEDASGNPYSFGDQRWYPRRTPIGEQHAFKVAHQTTFRRRGDCSVVRVEDWLRKMWLVAVWDRYWWGPDLGERATVCLAYDPTGGVHTPDRGVELFYFAHGAGWVRWEFHRSDRVYAHGAATFTDDSRVNRSDFYFLGGQAVVPQLTGCVAQALPVITSPPPPHQEPPPMSSGPSLHVWTVDEFPQVVQARRDFLQDAAWEPDPAWVILQMARRYGFGLPPGELPWTLQAMINHEHNPEGH